MMLQLFRGNLFQGWVLLSVAFCSPLGGNNVDKSSDCYFLGHTPSFQLMASLLRNPTCICIVISCSLAALPLQASAVPENVKEARAWIDAWKSKQVSAIPQKSPLQLRMSKMPVEC